MATNLRSQVDHPTANPTFRYDFIIVGTGLVGATYARKIREGLKDATILMIDAGGQYSKLPGQNAKNIYIYNYSEDGLDTLSNLVKAELLPVSRTPDNSYPEYLPPSSQSVATCDYAMNGANPNQQAKFSMPSAFSSFQVGGMGGHWTCCTPRPYQTQRIDQEIIARKQMDELLQQAQKLYHTNQKTFQNSLRGQIIVDQVNQFFKEHPKLVDPKRLPGMLPLAVQKYENQAVVQWTGVDHILGKDLLNEWKKSTFFPSETDKFWILSESLAVLLHFYNNNTENKTINHIQIKDLKSGKNKKIMGKKFIICGNSFYTPQLLHMSNIRPPALGRYLNEHSMLFCQIVLKNDHVLDIENRKKADKTFNYSPKTFYCDQKEDCKDPYEVLAGDAIPNSWIPYSEKFPFHVQIHRDSFPYSILPENMGIDRRLIIDIRFFMKTDISKHNRVVFAEKESSLDIYGLPQPTIHFERSKKDGERIDEGMKYMQEIAGKLGAYLKGVEPRVMPRGSSLHFMGTTRIGKDPETSTCNENSKVWGTTNVYVGGNGNIPAQTACNPTLTSSAIAIKAVRKIIEEFKAENQ